MFWEQLGLYGQVFFVMGCVASGLLIIQFILLLFGLDDGGADMDVDGGLGIFTVKGLLGFFTIAGWVGLACYSADLSEAVSTIIAVVCGIVAFVGIGLAYGAISKLQSNGIMDNENALGKVADVYLTIPAKNGGQGKISIVVQGRLTEFDAVTEEEESISTGHSVLVVGIKGDICVVVTDLDRAVVPIKIIPDKKKNKFKK